jgi:ABC-type transport system involved in cytochrome c biogenesis permease component
MSIRNVYRAIPQYFALPLAFLAFALIATVLAALNAFNGPDGPGAGVLVILVALNIAVPGFIAAASILVNAHHRSSWRVPAMAFLMCIVLIRLLGPFEVRFAPFMLGTGAGACAVSCWFLRRKEIASPKHALQTQI